MLFHNDEGDGMRELQLVELCFVSGGGITCGPQDSWASNFVPDSPFGFDFGEACRVHDTDFAQGILSMSDANSQFLDRMLTVANGNPVGVVVAYVYYGFVSVFGGFFYGPANAGAVPTQSQAEAAAFMAANDFELAGLEDQVFDWYDDHGIENSFMDDLAGEMGYGGGRQGDDPFWTVPHSVSPPVDSMSNELAMA